jgi:toxin FitB
VIVVDTNVVSELMKTEPSAVVQAWRVGRNPDELRITVLTVAEILCCLERLPRGRRNANLRGRRRAVCSSASPDDGS